MISIVNENIIFDGGEILLYFFTGDITIHTQVCFSIKLFPYLEYIKK